MYKLSFLFDSLFSLKKYNPNYMKNNKNFLVIFFLLFTLYGRYILEKENDNLKKKICEENKKLRMLNSIV